MRLSQAAARPSEAAGAEPDTVSVIIPVLSERDGLEQAYRAYRQVLDGQVQRLEFIYVLHRSSTRSLDALVRLKSAGEPLAVIVLSRWDGEGAALRSGFRHARGSTILTLPAVPQVVPDDLPEVLAALAECDLVVAWRGRPAGSRVDGLQGAAFHWLIRRLFGVGFTDLVCRVRACRRQVLEELAGYAMHHHFLPLLAHDRGLQVREIEVRAAAPGTPIGGVFNRRVPLARLRLMLDLLALYVGLKFVRKPLRFFGAIGLPVLLSGLVYTAGLGIARLFFGVPLADRPALLLGVLLVVLGLQIIALGLIGEIIIFASGKRIRDYTVEKIL